MPIPKIAITFLYLRFILLLKDFILQSSFALIFDCCTYFALACIYINGNPLYN